MLLPTPLRRPVFVDLPAPIQNDRSCRLRTQSWYLGCNAARGACPSTNNLLIGCAVYPEFFDDPAVVTPHARCVLGPAVIGAMKKQFWRANDKAL